MKAKKVIKLVDNSRRCAIRICGYAFFVRNEELIYVLSSLPDGAQVSCSVLGDCVIIDLEFALKS